MILFYREVLLEFVWNIDRIPVLLEFRPILEATLLHNILLGGKI